tara:strand:- start:299 stop:1099 length:801 start_codon:yes stop_codon:yes gene_type:complete
MAKANLNKFVLLAGLPRTGSSLLSNVLAQNSKFYAEGNSGLCQLMWDTQQSCNYNCVEQLKANNKLDAVKKMLVGGLPDLYYQGVCDKVIFDKCRPWVLPNNMEMAQSYIAEDVKAIVMVRPIDEIVRSFAKLYFAIGRDDSIYKQLMDDNYDVIAGSFAATFAAASSKADNLLFISYENIIKDFTGVLDKIYNFIGEDRIIHDTSNIKQSIKEDTSVYETPKIHDIRSKISISNNDIILPAWVEEKTNFMTRTLFEELNKNNITL